MSCEIETINIVIKCRVGDVLLKIEMDAIDILGGVKFCFDIVRRCRVLF